MSGNMSTPNIYEFYANKNIFITGSTGFLGKVILEKLLRSCPGIEKIYLIIRLQKGKSLQSRLNDIINAPLFDTLREKNPDAFKKLIAIKGDMSDLKLGLSSEDYQTLADKINIVFHVAASVRFDDSLTDAVRMNTRGTLEVLELALKMKQLLGLVHVSTTYCNCDRKEVHEIIYPPHADWKTTINIIEKIDPAVVTILTPKLLGTLPNTYTYSKSLSEQLVNSYKDKLKIVIFRPSIVISSWKEPIAGWLDSFNGPVSIMLGAGKGVIRTCLVDPDIVPDYMPVDIAAKAIIAAVWQRGINRSLGNDITVYNCSSMSKSISMRQLMIIGFEAFWSSPEPDILWTPTAYFCQNQTWFYINCIFKHFLPAVMVDAFFRLTGQTPMLVKLHKKIYRAMISLSYFTLREWRFTNDNFLQLNKLIAPEDKADFDYDFSDIDPKSFFENAMLGGRKFLLKEDTSNERMDEARIKAHSK
ncbi:fatty acyl-CoA reductase 1-like [Lycorma delicatula]|uniref:fatty acyl-CoA reductase 1-like n=1 Tax=Lycorma delicatula TaxID=130591 RepID=UPI003F51A7B2